MKGVHYMTIPDTAPDTTAERIADEIKKTGKTLIEISKEIEERFGQYISTGTLSEMCNTDKEDKGFSYKYFIALSKYFGVSADYLMCIRHERTLDKYTLAVCDYTGLSEEAVKNLHETEYSLLNISKFLNYLILRPELFWKINDLKDLSVAFQKIITEIFDKYSIDDKLKCNDEDFAIFEKKFSVAQDFITHFKSYSYDLLKTLPDVIDDYLFNDSRIDLMSKYEYLENYVFLAEHEKDFEEYKAKWEKGGENNG